MSLFSTNKKPLTLTKKRLFSFYIDMLVIFGLVVTIHLSLKFFSNDYLLPYLSQQGSYLFNHNYEKLIGRFYQIAIFNYFLLSIYLSNGSTIGTIVMKLKITDNNDKSDITFNQAFIRASVYSFSIMTLYLPFLFNLISKKKHGFADLFSGSNVCELDNNIKDVSFDNMLQLELLPILVPAPVEISPDNTYKKSA